jgi:hypothetical protein
MKIAVDYFVDKAVDGVAADGEASIFSASDQAARATLAAGCRNDGKSAKLFRLRLEYRYGLVSSAV